MINEERIQQIKNHLLYTNFICEHSLKNLKLSDFDLIKNVYNTSFNKYYICKRNEDVSLYTIRITQIELINKKKIVNNILREKESFNLFYFKSLYKDEPFYIGTFHNNINIYFVFKSQLCGKLSNLMSKYTFSDDEIQYILSNILFNYKHIAENKLLLRSITPNLLSIDINGNIIITDLLNSKVYNNRSFTLCFDNEYMEPRMVLNKGYDYRCDIWCMGILLYELYAKHTPFKKNINDTDAVILQNIVSYKENLQIDFTDNIPESSKKLITDLLNPSGSKRIGCSDSSRFDFYSIKEHSYFNNFNWNDLFEDKIIVFLLYY